MVILIVGAVAFSSCKNQEGVERSFVSKRKYSKGWHWQGFRKNKVNNSRRMARENIDKIKSRSVVIESGPSDEVSPSERLTLEPMIPISDFNLPMGSQSPFHNIVYGPGENGQSVSNDGGMSSIDKRTHESIVKVIDVSDIQESTMPFSDFIQRFPLNYGYDRPEPLEKRALELDEGTLSTFTFRSMLGTGLVGTSFVISATSLMSLMVLLGFIMTRMTFFIAGRRYTYEELRSMTTTGLILGGLVVVSSSIAIASALLS